MKHISRVGWLTVVLCCLLTADSAWAFPGPSDLLHSLSHDFLRHNSQGYLGVDVEDFDGPGAEVFAVDHDAPAAKAGLKAHDVLLQMDGQTIDSCDQLRHMLHKEPPGRTVNFVVGRDGSTIHVTVQLADQVLLEHQAWSHHFSVPDPAGISQGDGAQSFVSGNSPLGSHFLGTSNPLYVGVEVNEVSAQLAVYFGITGGMGLLVENVDSESPASRAGLRAGDLILKVNAAPMASRGDWQKAIRNNRGKLVELTIMRNKQERTLTMSAGISRGGG